MHIYHIIDILFFYMSEHDIKKEIPCLLSYYRWNHMDVGQSGRPREPQMWMSSLVLTIHNFGVPNFDP